MHLPEEITGVLKNNIKPKNIYRILDCKAGSESVVLGEIKISSVSLAGHLAGCRHAALLAATLGAASDMLIRKYSILDMGKAMLAQNISAAMIESYLDETEKEISQIEELKNLYPVARFSPGYGDFNITCQKDILNFLDASRIGISLTEGYMMIPSKSVTAVIGFSEEKRKTAGKCSRCDDKKCRLREEKNGID